MFSVVQWFIQNVSQAENQFSNVLLPRNSYIKEYVKLTFAVRKGKSTTNKRTIGLRITKLSENTKFLEDSTMKLYRQKLRRVKNNERRKYERERGNALPFISINSSVSIHFVHFCCFQSSKT